MRGRPARRLSAVIAAGGLGFAIVAASANAYTKENCYWPRVERGQSIPWTSYATGPDQSATFAAKDAWNNTPTKVLISGSGTYIQIHNGNYGNTGWYGQTYFTCSSGVFQAPVDSYINDYYGTSGNHLQAVVGHEFGHALGLGHSSDCNALMYTYPYTCGVYTPQTDDVNGLNAVYP